MSNKKYLIEAEIPAEIKVAVEKRDFEDALDFWLT